VMVREGARVRPAEPVQERGPSSVPFWRSPEAGRQRRDRADLVWSLAGLGRTS